MKKDLEKENNLLFLFQPFLIYKLNTMKNLDTHTVLEIIKMIDTRIEQLNKEFDAKGISFPMPRVKELQDLSDYLQEYIEAEVSKAEE